mmetsp:Transcript_7397/g.14075  ORF Transcript_7397/g.14075 Transcript_7397/m.14075 type:complete len:211 (+) Transcript_7397:266-898(+)
MGTPSGRLSSSSKAMSPASRQMAIISAPENPSLILARDEISTDSAQGRAFNPIAKIRSRLARSGGPTYIMRSILPGRVNAGSSKSGRFVAPTTTTLGILPSLLPPEDTPSNSVKSCDSIRLLLAESPDPRLAAIASISSKKIIAGLASLARRKSEARALSLSPSHLLRSSGPLTAKKFICPSVAKARAVKVFEHPGGPYNKIPRGLGRRS